MERTVRFVAPRIVDLVPTGPLEPAPGQVRVRTLFSGVSAGTELTAYLGTNPYLTRRWDPDRRLFHDRPDELGYPLSGWGYEEVGEVLDGWAGPDGARLRPGDVVWGIWGHRSDGVLPAEQAVRQVLPAGVDPVLGVFARVGAVALNAVIEADAHVGETVCVFGQGVIGLLATRLLALSGARVVAVDVRPGRLALAGRFGAEHTVLAPDRSAAAEVRELTEGRGADACVELSGGYPALQEAIRTVGYCGRVVAAGFYQGTGEALRLGEEFHHNRVEVVASQISGPPPRHAHRWSRERLHREFMRLVAEGRVDPAPLVTHVLPADRVADAFAVLAAGDGDALQVVLDFRAGG